VARALGFGLLAAILGANIWCAITGVTGYQFGLVAILIGRLVGWAVRRGSQGRGGRFYQVTAVVLTYGAIVSTYIPLMLQSAGTQARAREIGATPTNAPNGYSLTDRGSPKGISPSPALDSHPRTPSLWKLLKAMAILFAFACAIPFMGGFQNIIRLTIIAFALLQAWRMNKGVELDVEGLFGAAAPAKSSG